MIQQFAHPLRVAILAGGDSSEREISLSSGLMAFNSLEKAGHVCEWFDPSERALSSIPWQEFDVCLIALHGGTGEDGTIQQELDQLGVCYTGSGPVACQLAMSKSACKEKFWEHDLPTLPYFLIHCYEAEKVIERKLNLLGYPAIMKPDSQGSSLGVSHLTSVADMNDALTQAFDFDSFAIIEAFAEGREFTVSVLDRQPLPIIEISTEKSVFDFQAKYQDAQTIYHPQPDISEAWKLTLHELAIRACEAIGTRGLARVDFIVDALGQPWLLEVNTVPGLTARSLSPMAAVQAGMTQAGLFEAMISDALREKHWHVESDTLDDGLSNHWFSKIA